jgi:hypothetical protein
MWLCAQGRQAPVLSAYPSVVYGDTLVTLDRISSNSCLKMPCNYFWDY